MAKEKLTLKRNTLYNLPNLANGMFFLLYAAYIPKFYADVVAINVAVMGFFLLATRFMDAVTDPLTGYLTDLTRTKYGRRRPWVLLSVIPLGISILFALSPPSGISEYQSTLWFIITSTAMIIFHTTFAIPYFSWGAEITEVYDERIKLFAMRSFLNYIGILTLALSPVLLEILIPGKTTEIIRQRFSLIGLYYTIICIVTGFACVYLVKEKILKKEQMGVTTIFQSYKLVKENRAFFWYLVIFGAVYATWAAVSSTFLFFAEYVIKSDQGNLMLFLFTLSIFPGVWIWSFIGKKLQKHVALKLCMIIGIFLSLILIFLGPGDAILYGIIAFVNGLTSGSGTNILTPSLLPDVIDYHEYKTGKRNEGAYYGMEAFTIKMMAAGAVGFIFFILGLSGYEANGEKTPLVIDTIRYLTIFVPLGLNLLALIGLHYYPIDREMHQKMREEIDERLKRAAQD